MNIALILAGGSGVRLGADIQKQYIAVQGKTVITHCLEVFGTHPQIDAIQIVAHVEWRESIHKQMPEKADFKPLKELNLMLQVNQLIA